MELYLFRHGEKDRDGYFIGWTDVELTAKGKKQNKEIARKISKIGAERIFTSDLKRTFIKGGVKRRALREINFGKWEGLSWREIEKKYPRQAAKYLGNPLNFRFPGGESYPGFKKRILAWVSGLKKGGFRRVAIVTHQGVIRVMVNHYLGKDFWEIQARVGKGIKVKIPRH